MLSYRVSLAAWVYPFALAGVGATIAVAIWADFVAARDLVIPTLSLFGTFCGAMFAFRLNEGKDLRKQSELRQNALNRALFTLIRQANAASQLVCELRKYPTEFSRAFNLPALTPPNYNDLTFDFAELDFLLDSSKPSVLMELSIAQECFQQMLESIRVRNKLYVEEIQPAIGQLGPNYTTVTAEEIRSALGIRLFGGACDSAKTAFNHVVATDISAPATHKNLHNLAKELFPGRKFISYEIPPARSDTAEESLPTEGIKRKNDYRWR